MSSAGVDILGGACSQLLALLLLGKSRCNCITDHDDRSTSYSSTQATLTCFSENSASAWKHCG